MPLEVSFTERLGSREPEEAEQEQEAELFDPHLVAFVQEHLCSYFGHHRGRKGDPLYGIRRTLQIGAEHLTGKQATGAMRNSTPGT
jgi:hypothetical protein